MGNTNGPIGLKPVRVEGGGQITLEERSIASGYNTNIFTGDPVEETGTGTNVAVAAGGNVDNYGVFVGCRYVDPQGKQVHSPYWPANQVATEIVALVARDPRILYEVQCDTLAVGDVGLLADWDDGAGNVKTGRSGRSLVASTAALTGKSAKILGLVPRPDNAYGAYAKALVKLVEHVMQESVSGVGGV